MFVVSTLTCEDQESCKAPALAELNVGVETIAHHQSSGRIKVESRMRSAGFQSTFFFYILGFDAVQHCG